MNRKLISLSAVATLLLVSYVVGADPQQAAKKSVPQPATLEGQLRVHPKFLYKYYIDGFGGSQSCALHPDELFENIKPGTRIRVRGDLATKFHEGTTPTNPSAFDRMWYIQMNVNSVTVVKSDKTPQKITR